MRRNGTIDWRRDVRISPWFDDFRLEGVALICVRAREEGANYFGLGLDQAHVILAGRSLFNLQIVCPNLPRLKNSITSESKLFFLCLSLKMRSKE